MREAKYTEQGSYAEETATILAEVGAVIEYGHFVYESGEHGYTYVNKDAIYPEVEKIWRVCGFLANEAAGFEPEVVVGPEKGGILIASHTARQLGDILGCPINSVFAEKDGLSGFEFKRGYEKFVAGKRVVVVEDVINTGRSVRKVVELVRQHGGEVVVVCAIVNRGGVFSSEVGYAPLRSLLNLNLETMQETECTLCSQSVPLNVQYGHGRRFLEEKGQL